METTEQVLSEILKFYEAKCALVMQVEPLFEASKTIIESQLDANDYSSPPDASISWRSGSLQGVLVSLHIEDVQVIAKAIRCWRKVGYVVGKPDDCPEIRRRRFPIYAEADTEHTAELGSLMFLFPWSEDAKCTFVKVGVKEEPVYELRCVERHPVEEEANDA